MARRSVAVPLLLDGNQFLDYLELERAYRRAKKAVVEYLVQNYGGRRASYFRVWHEVKNAVKRLGLPFAYAQQAVKDAVEAYNAWATAGGRPPEIRKVSPYTDERAWRLNSATALSIRLMSGRHVVELWPHRRFWLFEWLVRTGRAKRAGTIRLKRVKNQVYVIFTYEIEPEGEKEPVAVTAFDVNENTVVAARVDLKASVDRVARWNREWVQPISIRVFRTDFGRLARRYDAIRRKWAEELSVEINGRKLSGTQIRKFRKRVKKLREKNRRRDRVNKTAHELTREPAILVTEDLGEKPQDEMVKKGKRSPQLRHRVKQTPMKAVVEKVKDKAAERGLKFVLVSAYRNSKTCPAHGEKLSFPTGPKIGLCPRGHWVHRDVASVLNMLRKVAERLEPKYAEAVRKALSEVDERQLEKWSTMVLMAEQPIQAQRPAVLARASPIIPPGKETVISAGIEGAHEPFHRAGRRSAPSA
ncbi:zinc ribbon domain-containing protein [Pyrobaculum sp.]|uniref:zinc ribbon domain-containing protein n=1 Tax=Pyrobaculum sp. TaxID=2004705 RepID=UPI003D0D091F